MKKFIKKCKVCGRNFKGKEAEKFCSMLCSRSHFNEKNLVKKKTKTRVT